VAPRRTNTNLNNKKIEVHATTATAATRETKKTFFKGGNSKLFL